MRSESLASAALCLVAACGSKTLPEDVRLPAGGGELVVRLEPFALSLYDAGGREVVATPEGEGLGVWVRPDTEIAGVYLDPVAPPATLVVNRPQKLIGYEERDGGFHLTYDSGAGPIAIDLQSVAGFAVLSVEAGGVAIEHALTALSFGAPADERYLGLGEHFDRPESRGLSRPMQLRVNTENEGSTDEIHAPVSFVVSSRGYGLYAESQRPGAFDLALSRSDVWEVRYQDRRLVVGLTAAPPIDAVAAYARSVGLPPALPDWALGVQQWRNSLDVDSSGTPSGADTLLADAAMLRALHIPASVLWIDAPWQSGYNTFAFNSLQFPDPDAMLAALTAQGFRVLTWATNYLDVSDDSGQMPGMPPFGARPLYDEFAAQGLFATDLRGQPFVVPWARGHGGMVDFTQERARAAYKDLARPLVERGVRGFKLDFGEDVRPELAGLVNTLFGFAGGAPIELHNRYGRLYHQTFRELLNEVHGDADSLIIARTASHGDQPVGAVIWPGDLDNDFSRRFDVGAGGKLLVGGLPAAVTAAISLAASGFPYSASDTGGYRGGMPKSEALCRWIQFSALLPVFQLGGGGAHHNPWDTTSYPEAWVLETFKRYARLHGELFYYFRELVQGAATTGRPMVRALGLSFPDDAAAWAVADELMVGDLLLVAPILTAGATAREVYFPAGTWIDFFTGTSYTGPATATVPAPLADPEPRAPLFVRGSSILPLAAADIDTFAAATAAGVVTHAAREGYLRARVSPGDAAVALADGRALQARLEGTGLTLTASGVGGGRVIWEVDLAAWDKRGAGLAVSDAAGVVPTVGVSELERCPRCAASDGGRWQYVSVAGDHRVTLVP
ncbi:MAG: glycoside hydrolase family 31 protein [Deltaproteobacteria bacterium]|nr:glycoside hydrolase family 31 protein [Deltaproteobacteria bacterium]